MSKRAYYQYQKELGLPVYVSIDLMHFGQGIQDFLYKMRFTKLSDDEEVRALQKMKMTNGARVLNITEATAIISKQIHGVMESDRYGLESIIPRPGYRVYRYKDVGLLVYSFTAREWELGCYHDFGSKADYRASRVVINRYLSWALSFFGVVGIWGVSVDEGMVARRLIEAEGEVVFIDVLGRKIITMDGVKKMSPRFKVLRLDPTIRGKNIRMTTEEYLSFLTAHCSYFDYAGLSVPIRQLIQSFVKMTEGLIHPEESFRPRTDLSL